jgi:hypothetical protein
MPEPIDDDHVITRATVRRDTGTTPTVGSCADCRWWDLYPTDEGGWGACALADSSEGFDHPRPDGRRQLAVAKGASGLTAVLVTRHDFGCVQWQGRTADSHA